MWITISLDLRNFYTSSSSENINRFIECNAFLKYWINEEKVLKILSGLIQYTNNNCPNICIINLNCKLIAEKKTCTDFCYYDDIYICEYNYICNERWLIWNLISSNNNYIYEEDLMYDSYYNYEKKNCLDEIPLGYYLNIFFRKK